MCPLRPNANCPFVRRFRNSPNPLVGMKCKPNRHQREKTYVYDYFPISPLLLVRAARMLSIQNE